jgi:hypothetical protein
MKPNPYVLGVFTVVIFAFNPLYRAEGQETGQVLLQAAPNSSSKPQSTISDFFTPEWVTAMLAIFTFGVSVWQFTQSQGAAARLQFYQNIAQTVLQSKTPNEAIGRAKAINALIGQQVSKDLGSGFRDSLEFFDPNRYSDGGEGIRNAQETAERQLKIDFWKTLLEHSNSEQQALDLWICLFPEYAWAKDLKIENLEKSIRNSLKERGSLDPEAE